MGTSPLTRWAEAHYNEGMDETSASLLQEIDAYLASLKGSSTRLSETTFGRKAVNDTKLVARLRAGGDLTLKKAQQIREFMAANVPSKEENAA